MFASQTFFLLLVCLGVFVVRGRSFRLCEGFRFAFIIFCQRWDVKTPGGGGGGDFFFLFLIFRAFFFFFFFFLPVEWQEVTKRFVVVRRGVGGGLPRKCLL